jgi:hypothetical protein
MNVVNVKMHYADDSEAGHHIIRSFLFLLRQVYAERTSIISTNDRPSSGSQVVQMNDRLYLLDNDVWVSTDALNWEKLTDEIVKGEQIFGYSAQVMDNKVWLLGCNRNGQFTSQVLVSSDGKTWIGMDAPWSPRGGIASTVYRGKIYMTGGKYGGTPNHPDFRYSNDLWVLGKN